MDSTKLYKYMWLNYKIDMTKPCKQMWQNRTDGFDKTMQMDVTTLFKWMWQGY